MTEQTRVRPFGGRRDEWPLVTVIATCYNHARFVEDCLESIRAQEYPALQLIITDDCSIDDSVSKIQQWLDRHLFPATLIANTANRGLVPTLNDAWRLAEGEFVVPMSTDDLMEPGRLQGQIPHFVELPPTAGVLYSDALVVDETGTKVAGTVSEQNWWFKTPPEGDVFPYLLRWNFVPSPAVVIRRSAKDAVGEYDESLAYEDLDMLLRLARHYEFYFYATPGARCRVVEGSFWRSRQVAIAESRIRILAKWLDDDELRVLVIPRLRDAVHHFSSLDRRASLPYLRMLCDLQPGWASRGRYALTRLGVGYDVQQRFITRFRS